MEEDRGLGLEHAYWTCGEDIVHEQMSDALLAEVLWGEYALLVVCDLQRPRSIDVRSGGIKEAECAVGAECEAEAGV
jgi:hypothetical protein